MINGDYELVKAPEDYPGKKYRNRYVYEHILVWWQNTGYVPPSGYVVHHINGNKRDNRFKNLEIKSVAAHTSEHSKPITWIILTCATCRNSFLKKHSEYKSKIKSGQNLFFCSRSCLFVKQQKKSNVPHGTNFRKNNLPTQDNF